MEEARKALHAGYGSRVMLEMSPDFNFGVLSPAFRGCEGNFALQEFAALGCNFFSNGLCELHGTGFQPLECLFCHHARQGLGQECHTDIEKDWNTPAGQLLIDMWANMTGLWERYGILRIDLQRAALTKSFTHNNNQFPLKDFERIMQKIENKGML